MRAIAAYSAGRAIRDKERMMLWIIGICLVLEVLEVATLNHNFCQLLKLIEKKKFNITVRYDDKEAR